MEPTNAPPATGKGLLPLTAVIAIALSVVLTAVVVLSSLMVNPTTTQGQIGPTPTPTIPTATPTPYDPSVGAVLPNYRIVAMWGIPGSPAGAKTGEQNGFAPDQVLLNYLHQEGLAYLQADPTTPVVLGIDLVVNVWQGQGTGFQYWSDWEDPSIIQQWIDFCQKNNLALFLDSQPGLEPIPDVVNYVLPYLEKYSFVHLELDGEYKYYPQTVNRDRGLLYGSDVVWTINKLTQIEQQYHLPRKVLIVDQFYSDEVIQNNLIQAAMKNNPNVSLVVQMDSVGYSPQKVTEYEQYVDTPLIEYGGFKLFYPPSITPNNITNDNFDVPLLTEQQVLSLNPAPLVITYQ